MLPLIEIDIDPVIAQIGPFALRWYSLMIMIGVMTGVWLAARFAERRGIAADDVYSAAFWIVGGGIVGARLAHVIDRWDYYAVNPTKILAVYEGGLAIWGGVIAGGLGGWLFTRRYHIGFWRFADAVSLGAIVGQAIGRFGCIVNGDVAGKPSGDWGFVYTNPHALLPHADYFNTPTYPYPFVEQILDLLLFATMYVIWRRTRFDGAAFLVYCAGYSMIRFFLTFMREEALFLFGLQQAQVLSLLVVIVAAYLYLYLRARPTVPRPTPAGA